MTRPLLLITMLALFLLTGGLLVCMGSEQASPSAGLVVGGEDPAAPAVPSAALTVDAAPAAEEAAAEPSVVAAAATAPRRSVVGVTLHGKVVDAGGRAIENGSLVLCNDQGNVLVARLGDASGEYEIAGVAPGRWITTVVADGYGDGNGDLELPGSSTRVRHDVVLEHGAFDVRLETPQGRALRDVIRASLPGKTIEVRVVATRGHPGAAVPTLAPGDDSLWVGRYQRARSRDPERPIDGTMRLAGLPPVHVSALFGRTVLATVHVPQATPEVRLVVPLERVRAELASLRARFVDADTAAPMRGAAAILIDAERLARSSTSDFADSDGSLVLVDQPPGRWRLELTVKGYEPFHRTVQLTSGRAEDLGTVRLSRCVGITGRVVDADGKPVRAQVSCHRCDRAVSELAEMSRAGPSRRYRARRNGVFRIPDVGRGSHVLVAQAPGYAVAKRYVETREGNVDQLEVVLGRGIAVTVDHRIEESNRYRFELSDAEGWVVHSQDVRSFAWPWRLRLTPGSYTLRIRDRGRLHRTLPIVVGSNPVLQTVSVE